MRKFLLIICCALMASCYFDSIEYVPGSTKFSIKNDSGVDLFSVRWNNIEFGDIAMTRNFEKEVADGQSYIYFNASNGKLYRTNTLFKVEKYKQNSFRFIDNTLVWDVANSTTAPIRLGYDVLEDKDEVDKDEVEGENEN